MVVAVVAALVFGFSNGFNDTFDVISTAVSTGAVPPGAAIAAAALLNFAGAFISIEVATTFAVSWKPLVKSKTSAVPTTMTRIRSELTSS